LSKDINVINTKLLNHFQSYQIVTGC